jgi:hypothetical protein
MQSMKPLTLAVLWLALAAVPAASQPSSAERDGGRSAFVVDLDTAGGFMGRGRGGVTIQSDGRLRAAPVGGAHRDADACPARLEPDVLGALRRAVDAAATQAWPGTFAPADDKGCCDRHTWRLRVEYVDAGGQTRTLATMWYDGNEARLPKDIAAIRKIALDGLVSALAACARR